MRLLSGIAGGLGVLGMCLSSVWALPPVLDRVPADAMVVMVIPSPDTLQKDLEALCTALEVPGVAIPKIEDLLMMGGITGGIDTAKSFAIVVMAPKPDAAHAGKGVRADKDEKDAKGEKAAKGEDKDEDDDAGNGKPNDQFIILLPTGDYAAFLGNFNVKPSGGLDTVTLQDADAQTMFVKNIGDGYTAMGPNKELVQGFAGQAGNAFGLAASMGAAGTQLADASDFFVVVNMATARPSAQKALEKAAGGLGGSPLGVMMNGGTEALGKWFNERIMNDTRTVVAGLKAGSMGLSLDVAATFNEGSYLSRTFADKGDSGSLLAKLPNQPCLAALALDVSSPGMKQFMHDLLAKGQEGDDADKAPQVFFSQVETLDGQAVAIGAPPGGVMSGLLVNTVRYAKTSRPEAYLEGMKATFSQLDKKSIRGTIYQTTYTPANTDVNGTKVDAWAIKMQPDAGADGGGGGMGATQGMALLFGLAGGPSGYISAVDGGVVQTFGKNSLLMGAALAAAKGGDSMASDKLLNQVSERLPANRLFEGYLGMKPIADAILPFLVMAGVQADIQVPETMPPVGLGIGSKDGAGRLGVFVPTPVLKLIAEIGMKVGAGHMGAPAGKPKDDTGQPKF